MKNLVYSSCVTARGLTPMLWAASGPLRRNRRRRGFVLLMTLVLIAIFALAMVGLARHSLRLALETVESEERVQRHWGRVSLIQSVLGRAEVILLAVDRERLDAKQEVVLGGTKFILVLGDEDAKINLNHVYQRGGIKEIRQVTDDLVGRLPLRYQRQPPGAAGDNPRPYQSWGQVFDCRSMPDSATAVRTIMEAGVQVTCWGNGKLNVRRASPASIESVSRIAGAPEVSARMIDELARDPAMSVEDLLGRLDLRDSQRQELAGWLTDKSTCYSLWITMVDNTRSRYELHVGQVSGEDPADVISFSW